MLSERIIEKIKNEIETKEDFDELMLNFRMSKASLDERDEAINYLKKQYPQFDIKDHLPTRELLQQIKDSEADTNDINGY